MTTKLKYGHTNTFFVDGSNGAMLIDTDYAGTLSSFYKSLKENNIKVSDISYVLATHYHPDHIGLVSELMKQGVKLLLIDTQVPYISFADSIFARDKRLNYKPIELTKSTIICREESRSFFEKMGINGEIIATPSHSEDSISLILDCGDCFVGDLEPIEFLDGYEHNESLQKDWKLVMNYEPKVIHYAHANLKILR